MIQHDYYSLAEELGIRGRVSGGYLRSHCPIHEGNDLNFSLNVTTGWFNCFSVCGNGNFYRLVSRVLDCSTTAALDWVSEHSFIHAEEYREPEVQIGPEVWREQFQHASCAELPKWWFDRGFTWGTAGAWNVRWDVAHQQLLIPVIWKGDLVGTVSRNFKKGPKYVNSPKLPRRSILFGLPSPVPESIFMVEGTTDVLSLWQQGLPAVALLGLQLSDQQQLLLRDCREVILALDNDEFGQAAQEEIATRWIGTRLASELKRVTFPEGRKDVGECTSAELLQMAAERRMAV